MNMQNDDEKFEKFLRQFQPRKPEPLPIEKQERSSRRRLVFGAWAAAAAAVLIAAVLVMRPGPGPTQSQPGSEAVANREHLTNPQTLTIGSANALLAQKPSVKAVVDEMAFKSQSTQPSKGMQSVLAVLSRENIKL